MSLPPPIPAPGTERVRCAFSGVEGAAADMLQIGGAWVAPEHKDAAVQWLQQGGALRDREEMRQPRPGLAETARQANGLIKEWWRPMLMVLAGLSLPYSLADAYKNGHPVVEGAWAKFLLFVLQTWLGAWIAGTMLATVAAGWSGGSWSFAKVLGAGLRRSMLLWMVSLPYLVAIMAYFSVPWPMVMQVNPEAFAMLVLALPVFLSAFAVSVLTSFSAVFIVDRRQGMWRSIGDSFRLVKRSFWWVLAFSCLDFAYLAVSYTGLAGLTGELPVQWQGWGMKAVAEWLRGMPQMWLLVFFFAWYKGFLGERRVERGGGGGERQP